MAQPEEIDALLHDYRARTQIHDALLRSCRGVDRLDRDLILSAYHPGAHDNHGTFAGPVEDFVEWVIGSHQGRVHMCVHHLSNVLMRIEGAVAHVESYVLVLNQLTLDGQLIDRWAHGRYADRFEDRGGEWRIAERHALFDWDRILPVDEEWDGRLVNRLLAKGERTPDDPSYRLLPAGFPF